MITKLEYKPLQLSLFYKYGEYHIIRAIVQRQER